MGKFRAIIFDIDATICDNTERKRRAIELTLNIAVPEELYSRIKKKGFPHIIKALGFEPNNELVKKVERCFLENEELYVLDRPIEGAVETLNALASIYRVGYVTGRPKEQLALDFLKRYGFPIGPVMARRIGSGEGMKKVEMFKEMLKRLGVEPSEAVSVGDMPEDGLASRAAGVLSVGVAEFSTVDVDLMRNNFDHIIERITDLPKLLADLEGGYI
ncbi:MAG: HAD family hydrolase [Thaumarchaeota archaeon]|jgi:phosphoglycolate phosphatase-like HAD superfamily hydrolase|nr:HAD family hydrolase [Candidatus Terraquivivens yellowstonensis]MCL7392249.1 HAD family hydrolase [Candidatus Terraquivivens yellowstonensis]MCL7395283.1 HAD family hydrolase [Candidatus Terraquivivens yellowstonensis]MCL7397484.1 HAD family hydrolase [Candidatus Terraquivivens yellowstonensis]MCL7399443.1 HAD family hydrolase [Candidatus Terraquivivens yellowstonensis]